jgi:hypothetical protein
VTVSSCWVEMRTVWLAGAIKAVALAYLNFNG